LSLKASGPSSQFVTHCLTLPAEPWRSVARAAGPRRLHRLVRRSLAKGELIKVDPEVVTKCVHLQTVGHTVLESQDAARSVLKTRALDLRSVDSLGLPVLLWPRQVSVRTSFRMFPANHRRFRIAAANTMLRSAIKDRIACSRRVSSMRV
jgi:hypothetical protein